MRRTKAALGPADREPRSDPVVVFATNVHWDGTWFGAQHLGSRLASRGFDVLFLELPVSIASPLRRPSRLRELVARRMRRETPTLAIDRPLGIPPIENPRTRAANAWIVGRRIRHDLHKLGWAEPSFVIAREISAWRLADEFRGAKLVANLSDAVYFSENPHLANERRNLVTRADAAVCVSPPLVSEAAGAGVRDTLLLPQGVDFDTVRNAAEAGPAPDLAKIPHPRIGLLGSITPRIDFALVDEVVQARPDWQFVFVGSATQLFSGLQRELPFARRPNVHLMGARDRHVTGRYLAGFDAAWVPYHWSEFNKSSNPLKILEYLAAGLPVVSPAFPALVGETADATLLAEGARPPDWVDALEAALARRSDHEQAARREFAATNSWDARADRLAEFLRTIRD